MNKKPSKLITIEGLDACGKTTLAERLSKKFGLPARHEPNFPSELADEFNSKGSSMHPWQREFHFIYDRIKDQDTLESMSCFLDSYILRSWTYALAYSGKSVFDATVEIQCMDYFKKPDLTIVLLTDYKSFAEIENKRFEENASHIVKSEHEFIKLNNSLAAAVQVYQKRIDTPIVIMNTGIGKFDKVYDRCEMLVSGFIG